MMLWISQAAVAAVKLKYQKLAESMFDDEFSKDQVTLIAPYHNLNPFPYKFLCLTYVSYSTLFVIVNVTFVA